MIRLLTAVLLFASFNVVADTEVPHAFTDGTPAKASEVNANFDALETAIDAIPEGPVGPQGEKGNTLRVSHPQMFGVAGCRMELRPTS